LGFVAAHRLTIYGATVDLKNFVEYRQLWRGVRSGLNGFGSGCQGQNVCLSEDMNEVGCWARDSGAMRRLILARYTRTRPAECRVSRNDRMRRKGVLPQVALRVTIANLALLSSPMSSQIVVITKTPGILDLLAPVAHWRRSARNRSMTSDDPDGGGVIRHAWDSLGAKKMESRTLPERQVRARGHAGAGRSFWVGRCVIYIILQKAHTRAGLHCKG